MITKYIRSVLAALLMGLAPVIVVAVLYLIFGNSGEFYDSEACTLFGVDVAGLLVMGVFSFVVSLPLFLWAHSRRERDRR